MLYSKKRNLLIIFPIFAIILIVMVTVNDQASKNPATPEDEVKGEIIVGGKDFTEQFILSEITSIYLKEKGYLVEEVSDIPHSEVIRSALLNNHIDLYWEYTGTAFMNYMGSQYSTALVDQVYTKVKNWDEQNNVKWLKPTDINNSYALIMSKTNADRLGIHSISDLAQYMNEQNDQLNFAVNQEFLVRDDGLDGLENHYDFQIPPNSLKNIDTGLFYKALENGRVDVSLGYATDGYLKNKGLEVLKDNRAYFPPYYAVPTIRRETLEKYPDLKKLLHDLSNHLNHRKMINLNYQVDVRHANISKVAREWLMSEELIPKN